MTIYCSKKLETYLGQTAPTINPSAISKLGNWNGHIFMVGRKRCLIFMNNLTCYSIVFIHVQKKNLKNFGPIFKERLITQLHHDIKLTEEQEIKIRRELADIIVTNSNNDKKILGTINHHIENLKFSSNADEVANWDELLVTEELNNYLVGTKILPHMKRNRDFFKPIELMIDLVK